MRLQQLRKVLKLADIRVTERGRRVAASGKHTASICAIVLGLAYVLVNPGGKGAYHYGQRFEAGETATVHIAGRRLFVTIAAFILLLYVIRGATRVATYGDLERFEELHLSLRTRVSGIFLAEALQLVILGSIPAAATAIAFGAGSGEISTGVSLLLVAVWMGFTLPFAGLAIGLVVNYLIVSRVSGDRLKILAGGICILVYSGLVTQRQTFVPQIADSPLGFPAILATNGSAVDRYTLLWTLLPGITAIVLILSVAVSEQVARKVWRSTRHPPAGVEAAPEDRGGPIYRRIQRLSGTQRQTALVTHLTLLNTVRSPSILLYAGLPTAGLGLVGYSVFTGNQSAWLLPIVALTAGVIAIGSSVTLNPLGAHSDAMPWLFAGVVQPREFVLGTALAGLVLGGPLFVAATVIAGVFATYSLVQLFAAAALSVGSLTTSALLSIALGLRFPNRKRTRLGATAAISLPSRRALLSIGAYGFVVALCGTVAVREPTVYGLILAAVSPLVFTICSLTCLQYSEAVLERGPLELVETRQYPSIKQALPARLVVFWDVLAVLAMMVGFSTVVGLVLLAVYGNLSEVPPSIEVGATLGAYACTSAVYLIWRRSRVPTLSIPSKRSLGTIVLGTGMLIGIGVVSAVVGPAVEDPTAGNGIAASNWVSILFLGIIIGPLLEEVLFRGIIQDRLTDALKPRYSIAIASSPFALIHLVTLPSSAVTAAAVGTTIWLQSVVLGTAYHRSKTLLVPFTIHIGYNAVALLPAVS